MAEEDEYSYVPNGAVIGAVQASAAPRGLQGAAGLGPARSDSSNSIPAEINNLRPKQRAVAIQAYLNARETASHNASMEALARAKYALDVSAATYGSAKERHDMIQQANQLNEAAGFFAEHANLNPYDPNYYQHVATLAAKYPGATDNKSVQAILQNPRLREQAALKGDVPGEVATRKAMQAGWVRQEDLVNPQLRNQDGSLNHDAVAELASLREGASVEPPHIKTARAGLAEINRLGTDLTPQQEGLKDMYSNTIFQFEKGRQGTLGIQQPTKLSAASLLPRAAAPVPAGTAPAPQTSIPKAPPPPTPAPTPISPEDATKLQSQYF